jgi:hypothetical protein
MGCLFVALAAFAPRIGVFLIWIARPGLVDAAFDTFIVPLLGFIFLPFTTLLYLIMFRPGTELSGVDFLWLGLALIVDVTHLGASSYNAAKETGWRSA